MSERIELCFVCDWSLGDCDEITLDQQKVRSQRRLLPLCYWVCALVCAWIFEIDKGPHTETRAEWALAGIPMWDYVNYLDRTTCNIDTTTHHIIYIVSLSSTDWCRTKFYYFRWLHSTVGYIVRWEEGKKFRIVGIVPLLLTPLPRPFPRDMTDTHSRKQHQHQTLNLFYFQQYSTYIAATNTVVNFNKNKFFLSEIERWLQHVVSWFMVLCSTSSVYSHIVWSWAGVDKSIKTFSLSRNEGKIDSFALTLLLFHSTRINGNIWL